MLKRAMRRTSVAEGPSAVFPSTSKVEASRTSYIQPTPSLRRLEDDTPIQSRDHRLARPSSSALSNRTVLPSKGRRISFEGALDKALPASPMNKDGKARDRKASQPLASLYSGGPRLPGRNSRSNTVTESKENQRPASSSSADLRTDQRASRLTKQRSSMFA